MPRNEGSFTEETHKVMENRSSINSWDPWKCYSEVNHQFASDSRVILYSGPFESQYLFFQIAQREDCFTTSQTPGNSIGLFMVTW